MRCVMYSGRTCKCPIEAQNAKKGRPEGLPEISVEGGLLRLLHLEDPDHAALGHIVADPDIGLRQLVLDALGVDTPA